MPSKHIAIYVRVSSAAQDIRSQLPDLERWAAAQELPVKWYEDKQTGTRMDRPGWNKLDAAMKRGEVACLCIWRMDRLGRTASGLTALFEELRERKVNFVSLKDGVDLSTPAGRMMANVLASVAQYETEVRGERVRAGIDAAHAAGKRWGGSKPGVRKKVSPELALAVRELHAKKTPVTAIARALKLSRGTIYSVLKS
jgi:DNA invertase Pin-like site-specific DNA recombinase